MENQEENCRPVHSYLLQKVQENTEPTVPLSLCTPISLLSYKSKLLKVKVTENNTSRALVQRSNHQNHISHRLLKIWVGISSKLWTVARCSTSPSNTDTELNNSSGGVFDSLEENVKDMDENLPGLQRRRQNRALDSRKSVANDMQVNHMIEQETGFQRLQAMYALGPDWMFIQEDTRTITTIFYRSVMLGFLLNIVKAAQSESKGTKHLSASQAAMKTGINSMADSRKIIKEAGKGSLRLTAFAGSIIYLSQSISAYRNQSSIWEYSISTAVAMACVTLGKSPKSFLLTVSGGALAGALGGSLICSMLSSAGASQEQRTLNRIRQQLEQQQSTPDFDKFENELIR